MSNERFNSTWQNFVKVLNLPEFDYVMSLQTITNNDHPINLKLSIRWGKGLIKKYFVFGKYEKSGQRMLDL